jgi:hypothetical protein
MESRPGMARDRAAGSVAVLLLGRLKCVAPEQLATSSPLRFRHRLVLKTPSRHDPARGGLQPASS